MIREQGYNGTYELRTKDGKVVAVGAVVQDFRGDSCTIEGGEAPHKEESEGRIHTSDGRFYARVCNLVWVLVP